MWHLMVKTSPESELVTVRRSDFNVAFESAYPLVIFGLYEYDANQNKCPRLSRMLERLTLKLGVQEVNKLPLRAAEASHIPGSVCPV